LPHFRHGKKKVNTLLACGQDKKIRRCNFHDLEPDRKKEKKRGKNQLAPRALRRQAVRGKKGKEKKKGPGCVDLLVSKKWRQGVKKEKNQPHATRLAQKKKKGKRKAHEEEKRVVGGEERGEKRHDYFERQLPPGEGKKKREKDADLNRGKERDTARSRLASPSPPLGGKKKKKEEKSPLCFFM